jgi:hypothetical protein
MFSKKERLRMINLFFLTQIIASLMVIGVFCDPEPSHYKVPPPYGAQPKYVEIPHCAKNTTKSWCLEDSEYPQHEVQQALDQHYQAVLAFYKDKLANTENSVDGLDKLNDEVYLCPSSTDYRLKMLQTTILMKTM